MRTVRSRECPICQRMFNDPHGGLQPARYCSVTCYLDWKRAAKPVARPRAQMPRTTGVKKRKAISPASTGQRLAVQGRACIVCRQHDDACDPAHLIDRSLLTEGQDDPRAVVPLCRSCHDGYDERGGDLLPYLEPHYRAELAYAVERYGLLRTLQRVTGQHWAPVVESREAA